MNLVDEFRDDPMFAILDGHDVVPTDDVIYWAVSRSRPENHLSQEEVNGYWISTVFLGINSGTTNHPRWFESMVFGPPEHHGGPMPVILSLRVETYEEALLAHFVHKQLASEMPPPTENDRYTCPQCGLTSHNPTDVKERYCGNCRKFADPN